MKTQIFSDPEITFLADRFKILSEVSRLKILRILFSGEKCVNNITEATGLLQANVSKQLKMMQHNGVITCRPDGLQRFYRIKDENILNICKDVCNHKKNNNKN